MLSFLLIGFAKGSVINMCTILVSNHSKNRTKGMNIMHSCYALGALLCPFIIAGAGLIGPVIPMLSLSFLGLVMWIIFQLTPIEKKTAGKKEKTDWDFLKKQALLASYRSYLLPERSRDQRKWLAGNLF